MSLITKPLVGILFNGAALALASAPWKENVRAVYGFTATGTGYQVFKPANQFNLRWSGVSGHEAKVGC